MAAFFAVQLYLAELIHLESPRDTFPARKYINLHFFDCTFCADAVQMSVLCTYNSFRSSLSTKIASSANVKSHD